MADNTHIEWTDATWNPITGCSVVSPGCTNCYAMQLAGTRLKHDPSRAGLTVDSKAGPVWNGEVRFNEKWLDQPLRWKRPRKIFVCAHGDLFHEAVPDDWIDQVFAVMALCPQHVFQVLTKRPERMRAYMKALTDGDRSLSQAAHAIKHGPERSKTHVPLIAFKDPLPNVWLGVSGEDQPRVDERVSILLDTPAAVRWISLEPMLGPVRLWRDNGIEGYDYLTGGWYELDDPAQYAGTGGGGGLAKGQSRRLDWVVLGGESGPGARPMHPDWARQVRDDCAAAGVPFLFKQWGAWREFGHVEDGPLTHDVEVGSDDANSIVSLVRPSNRAWLTTEGRCYRKADDIPDGPPARFMERLGKKAAGRLLDGVTHDGYPEGAA